MESTKGVTNEPMVDYTMEHILEYRRHPWNPRGTPFGFAIVVAICGTRVWEGHVVARRVWGTSGTRIYHMGHP